MISPSVLIILLLSVYPVLFGSYIAFTKYNLMSPGASEFTGLKNITRLLTNDPEFYEYLGFTFTYTISVTLGSYLLGLGLALLLNRELKFRGLIRAAILIPWVIPPVIAGICWKWLLMSDGMLNRLLMSARLIREPVLFLGTADFSRMTVIVTGIWSNFPFMTLVILASLQGIPGEIYESAKIDGARATQSFRYITLPLLREISVTVTSLVFIWTYLNFENIYTLTMGGPANKTMTLSIFSYNTAFNRGNIGYASAITVIELVSLTVLVQVFRRVAGRRERTA